MDLISFADAKALPGCGAAQISVALLQRHKLGPSYRHHLDSEPAKRPGLGDRHEDL